MLQNLYRALKRNGLVPQRVHDFAKRLRNWSHTQRQNARLVDDVNSLSAVISDLKTRHAQLARKVETLQREIDSMNAKSSRPIADQADRPERLG